MKDVVQTENWSMIKIATNAIKCDIFLVIGSSLAIPEFRAYVNDFIKKHPESRVIVVNTVAQEESPHYNQIKVDHWITLEADAFVSGIHLNSNPFSGLVNNINEFKQLTEKWHMGHNGNTDPGIREITQLRAHAYINDETINFFISTLEPPPDTIIMNTFWISYVTEKSPSQIAKWKNDLDIYRLHLLVVPINVKRSHWYVVVLDMKNCHAWIFDSIKQSPLMYNRLFKVHELWPCFQLYL